MSVSLISWAWAKLLQVEKILTIVGYAYGPSTTILGVGFKEGSNLYGRV